MLLKKKVVDKRVLEEEQGAITVWLTLLSVCMISFVILVIEHTRIEQARSTCTQSTSIAVLSAMADYEPDIYDNYHIFVLDECYGGYVRNKDKLKDNILKYANMSVTPNYIGNPNDVKDIIGCLASKVNVNNTKYFNGSNDNFISQICSYMECNKDKDEVEVLMNKYGTSKEKHYLCTYILEHFSSYKSLYVLGYMKRQYVYEVEYLIYGKNTDNANMKKIMGLLKEEDVEEITRTEDEYKEVLYEQLVKMDEDKLCNRIKNLIIDNINSTFDKELKLNCLVTAVDVEIEYEMDKRATNIQLITKWLGERYFIRKIECKEKFNY